MGDPASVIRSLPIWSGPVTVVPLAGGLSNANFRVEDGGRRFMVRLGSDLPFHHVFRDREVAVARAAHAAGVSPPVVHAEPGAAVYGFLDARTLDAGGVRRDWRRVVELLRRAHAGVGRHLRGPAPLFWVFHVIRDYAVTLRAGDSRIAGELPALLAVADRLEAAQPPMPMVFGHHDLLPANLMDDGERLWLIDWEYGGYGTPLFDLANLAGNAGLGEADERALLQAYFGGAPDPRLWHAYGAMKAAALLREALWGLVSEMHMATVGVDYGAYAAENLERFRGALAGYQESAG